MDKWWILLGWCFFIGEMHAQRVDLFGFLPSVQLDSRLQGETNFFFQLASESQPFHQEQEGVEFPSEIKNLDLHAGLTKDLGANWNLAAALMTRLREPFAGNLTSELRPWQQATLVHRFQKFRFRNRLRAEQRFIQREPRHAHRFDLRLRYRLP
jgi:hypothetical protein